MNDQTPIVKIAQVFNNGRSRAIRIPKEFEFDADQVEIRMDGLGNLLVHPMKKKSLLQVLAGLEPLPPEDWMNDVNDDDLPALRDIDL